MTQNKYILKPNKRYSKNLLNKLRKQYYNTVHYDSLVDLLALKDQIIDTIVNECQNDCDNCEICKDDCHICLVQRLYRRISEMYIGKLSKTITKGER